MKNQIKTLLTIITVILGINSISAQGNFQGDGAGIGTSATLYGDGNSALYWFSKHNTISQLIMRNKSGTNLGRLYGAKNQNGTYIGLLDGDGNWSYLAAKDAYTQFRINNKAIATLRAGGLSLEARDSNAGGNLTFRGAGSYAHWNVDAYGGVFRIMNTKNSNVLLRINEAGNIGIGTSFPDDNKLDVNGTIRAKEVKVQSDWADYVFDEAYELPSLNAEEENIESNGHLLGFDSEAEMAGEIQLADVAKKQQVKIEEIMLHLIEMNKKIELLEEDKASLNAELKLLKQ